MNVEGCSNPGFVGTRRGMYDLFNFKQEHVNKNEIFHVLGHLCRYGGRCKRFFSIAQHSLLVHQILLDTADGHPDFKQIALGGLCHDFGEAYMTDIIRPIKMMIEGVEDIEESIMMAISEALPVGLYDHYYVKTADNIALYHEAKHLEFNTNEWGFSDEIKLSRIGDEAYRIMESNMPPEAAGCFLRNVYRYTQQDN